jgi:hypothetical protein
VEALEASTELSVKNLAAARTNRIEMNERVTQVLINIDGPFSRKSRNTVMSDGIERRSDDRSLPPQRLKILRISEINSGRTGTPRLEVRGRD